MRYSIFELFYFLIKRFPKLLWGKYIRKNIVKVHWGRGLNNFGDCLQPYILKHYGLTPYFVSNLNKSDIILQGSVLEDIDKSYDGIILGTGIHNAQKISFPNARIIGTRGLLSLSCLDNSKNTDAILGDPGIIMSKIFNERTPKKYKLGIIFHFSETHTNVAKHLRQTISGKDVIFINVLNKPRTVINQIKSCQTIVSSSLHGLIIADSFSIPNRRIKIKEDSFKCQETDFKYLDYYSTIECTENPLYIDGSETADLLINSTTLKSQQNIQVSIAAIDHALIRIANYLKSNNYKNSPIPTIHRQECTASK